MRYLFLSYSYPGPLGPMASWLAKDPANQVIFASSRLRQNAHLANVQRVLLRRYQGADNEKQDYIALWEEALRAARSGGASLGTVKKSGFMPDMIFNASSSGVAIAIRDIYPEVFRVNFVEDESFVRPAQAAMRRSMQCLQILNFNQSYVFTAACKKLYPPELRPLLRLAPRLVESAFFGETPTPGRNICVFCGSHEIECLKLCQTLAQNLPSYKIRLAPGNSFFYKRLRTLLAPDMDIEIINAGGRDLLAATLKSAALAIFPDDTGPILEACALATPLMLPEKNRYGISAALKFRPENIDKIAKIMDDGPKLAQMGESCRQFARSRFNPDIVMPEFFERIRSAYAAWDEHKKH